MPQSDTKINYIGLTADHLIPSVKIYFYLQSHINMERHWGQTDLCVFVVFVYIVS